MFNATEILIDAFGLRLREGYRRMYGGIKPDYEDIICWASSMSLENIANSDGCASPLDLRSRAPDVCPVAQTSPLI
jgi:hypothetical protein